jgi:hypothetical protein
MRSLSLTSLICLWCISQVPVVVAGTRGFVEKPAQVENALCSGADGNWYPQGAQECQPQETAGTRQEAAVAEAPEGSGGTNQLLYLLAGVAATALAVAAIAAALRTPRRVSRSDAAPKAQPPDVAARSQADRPATQRPTPQVASEVLSAAPAPGASEQAQDQLALADGEAPLVTVWTGGPYTVEFTSKDQDGDWHRNTVDITSILRDRRDGGWHLRGFCHLWREERDYDRASIVTKILHKSRRWNLQDWIAAVAGTRDQGS